MAISLSSQRRLEFNLTSVFIEMAITSATLWNRQSETARKDSRELGAPFMVRNQTGYSILVWSDSDRKASSKPASVKRLADGHSMPWRFEDHKRLREVSLVNGTNA
jgi:vacuolar protein sorting-associated protein 13A/C